MEILEVLHYTEEDKRSLYESLLRGYERAGDKSVALAFYGNHITWKQFMHEVDCLAAALLSRKVKPGDAVTIFTPNIPQGVIAIYAANRIGAVANMVHPLSSQQEVLHAIDLTGSKIVFTVELNEELVSNRDVAVIRCKTGGYFPGNPVGTAMKIGYGIAMKKYGPAKNVASTTAWSALLKEGEKMLKNGFVLPPEVGKHEDTAVIMYTGGTTGPAKGVMISNYALNSISMQMLVEVGEGNTDVEDGFLALLPIFHAFGLAVCIHAPMISGMKVVLVPRFETKGCFKQIKKEHVIFIPGVPAMFERLYPMLQDYDLSDVKLVVSGGDRVSNDLTDKYNKLLKKNNAKVKFRAGYGLTESCGACILTPNEYGFLPNGCIGVPLGGVEYCLTVPGTTEPAEEGAEGELCYFGPGMMTGYYNNPEATAEVLREHADGRIWLHTGDIVQLDDGMICFRSRHKRMIKVNGYNVYPSLIEDVIIEHPSVKQVCAVATPYKDDRRIKLFVVPEEGANLETLEADLIAYAADKVNRWSVPKKVEVIDAMPLTKMNKVDYMALQEQEMAGKSA